MRSAKQIQNMIMQNLSNSKESETKETVLGKRTFQQVVPSIPTEVEINKPAVAANTVQHQY
jgi:hypothetical protein